MARYHQDNKSKFFDLGQNLIEIKAERNQRQLLGNFYSVGNKCTVSQKFECLHFYDFPCGKRMLTSLVLPAILSEPHLSWQ